MSVEPIDHARNTGHEITFQAEPGYYGGGFVRVTMEGNTGHTGKPVVMLMKSANDDRTWRYVTMDSTELDELITVLAYYKQQLDSDEKLG